jgi:hypothetical protein
VCVLQLRQSHSRSPSRFLSPWAKLDKKQTRRKSPTVQKEKHKKKGATSSSSYYDCLSFNSIKTSTSAVLSSCSQNEAPHPTAGKKVVDTTGQSCPGFLAGEDRGGLLCGRRRPCRDVLYHNGSIQSQTRARCMLPTTHALACPSSTFRCELGEEEVARQTKNKCLRRKKKQMEETIHHTLPIIFEEKWERKKGREILKKEIIIIIFFLFFFLKECFYLLSRAAVQMCKFPWVVRRW